MDNSTILKLCGIHSFLFAIFHAGFWQMFAWKSELKKTSISTRAIIQILNLRLIYVFLLIGTICFLFPYELRFTPLGNFLMLGMSAFWVGRLIEQVIFLRYHQAIVYVLGAMFIIGAALFAIPVIWTTP